MNTSIMSHQKTEIAEKAQRLFYSFQVMVLGLLIPFLFVFGITFHSQRAEPKYNLDTPVYKQVISDHQVIGRVAFLADQHS